MKTPTRRQDHSCDQCRKGKRRCDAPKLRDFRPSSCSNCTKYHRECTYDWLSSRQAHRKQQRKRLSDMFSREPSESTASSAAPGYLIEPMDGSLFGSQDISDSTRKSLDSIKALKSSSSSPINHEDSASGILATSPNTDDWHNRDVWEEPYGTPKNQPAVSPSTPSSTNHPKHTFSYPGNLSVTRKRLFQKHMHTKMSDPTMPALCILSDQTANKHARLTTTQSLVRIYHDSMENALSCWLTERNCPYSVSAHGTRNEWGPQWSNRICARVCQLDQASTSIKGRALSPGEDQTAARVLHLSIMAFASQWTQNSTEDPDQRFKMRIADAERSLRESVWNQTRHALEQSTGIPSFRIIFANILFALTQRPLGDEDDVEFDELIERDTGHLFLEAAVRQLLSFRYKLKQLHRAGQNSGDASRAPRNHTRTENLKSSPENYMDSAHINSQVDPTVSSQQHRDTFDLLFWLGIMFDTQNAAMYQRPPVISDENSQIISGSQASHKTKGEGPKSLDLDGFSIFSKDRCQKKQNLWGDMLLHIPVARQRLRIGLPVLPCSYEQAAEILTDAAPVKVLLWRRITQLQTAIYQEADPECLEEGIQKALSVYQYWNSTYNKFILDCVAYHALLPARIQSWYVVLAAHWYLGAMLLADVIEGIDQECLSLKSHRESRQVINFALTMRKDNASAIATLAHCSLHEQTPGQVGQFHDSLAGAAFLTEPFTVLLIHSFTRSANFFLDHLSPAPTPAFCNTDGLSNQFYQHCEVCIHALECLGRKSDMALIVARSLSKRLKIEVEPQWSKQTMFDSEHLLGSDSVPWPTASAIDLEHGVDHEALMYQFLV